jgi:antiviral helicase SKI2
MRTIDKQDKNIWIHLVHHLRREKLLPVVIFVFSKRRCEENAAVLTNIDLCTASEKSEVHIVVEKSIARLKVEDRGLPQIRRIRDLLGRGVAVHHGGLLPIVKEVTTPFEVDVDGGIIVCEGSSQGFVCDGNICNG